MRDDSRDAMDWYVVVSLVAGVGFTFIVFIPFLVTIVMILSAILTH